MRSGEDTRRRGWYWHWNELVTQYSPLIGLKGVGLLNSYTVWTDRREASPHRGYAFPSQQSEADFYGEDRAELIAINKILVALDLIEIRKEMVLRTDPQGRRWRVPHNFYRVKDHPDGFTVSARDVLKVAALADRDKAVYRYVRRAFSPRFAPIDADNPWHRILPELRQTELWQRLSAQAAREEDRASARTRAGHAVRRANAEAPSTEHRVPSEDEDGAGAVGEAGFFVAAGGDGATTGGGENDTAAVHTALGGITAVAGTNRGSTPDVGGSNTGSDPTGATSVDAVNEGRPSSVGPTNTTYDQSVSTTTTTVDGAPNEPTETLRDAPPRRTAAPASRRDSTDSDTDGDDTRDSAAAAVRAFEDANARPATPAERNLLRGLADRFDLAALAAAELDEAAPESGWGWVAAAAYEAVEAGSAFVAPRRLREILLRWEREGYPPGGGEGRAAEGGGGAVAQVRAGGPARPSGDETADHRPSAPPAPDLPLPHGHGSRRTWAFVVGLLGAALDRETLADLVAGTAIVGYRDGEVTLSAPAAAQAERLATTHRDLIERKLGEAMRRPVRLNVTAEGGGRRAEGGGPSTVGGADISLSRAALGGSPPPSALHPPSVFVVAESGLPSDQIWAAVLAELEAGEAVSRANYDAWLRGTLLLGRGGGGAVGSPLVVGAPHALAQRRLAERFLPALREAVALVVGTPLPVEIAVAREWLHDASDAPEDETRDQSGDERRRTSA